MHKYCITNAINKCQKHYYFHIEFLMMMNSNKPKIRINRKVLGKHTILSKRLQSVIFQNIKIKTCLQCKQFSECNVMYDRIDSDPGK